MSEYESIERYELIATIYKLTSTPNLGAAKFGDGVWADDPYDGQDDHCGWFSGWYVGI
jgi:hypothetical protein